MPKLSDLIRQNERTIDSLTPSQTAMHALRVDDDGILTYTKILWDSDEAIDLSDGSGFAYLGVEEFVDGKTLSGVQHNLVQPGQIEVGEKDLVGKDVHVTVVDRASNPKYALDGLASAALTFVRGAKYTFIVSDESTQGFPLFLTTVPAGGTYDNEYLDGVRNSRTASGGSKVDARAQTDQPLEIVVPDDAPDILYYASGNHANCFGKIDIKDSNELSNLKHRKYDQVRFDNQKLTYYMNSEGFLVARYNKDYNYS